MKKLINKDGWKVIGYNVFRVRVWRETENFWVFMRASDKQEYRQEKRGTHLFWTKEEAMAHAEKVLTEKVESARKNLAYMCKQVVTVVD